MPCPKLNITDFFRFAETKKIINHAVTDLCFPQEKINFRFSSEYFDNESGLVYYNYRYYSPEFGRWLSRDPIWEDGGYNLYGFTINQPINFIDTNGEGITSWAMGYGYDTPEARAFDEGFAESVWDSTNGYMDAATFGNADLEGWHGGDESRKAYTFDPERRAIAECFAKCWAKKSSRAILGTTGVSYAIDAYDLYDSIASNGNIEQGLNAIGNSSLNGAEDLAKKEFSQATNNRWLTESSSNLNVERRQFKKTFKNYDGFKNKPNKPAASRAWKNYRKHQKAQSRLNRMKKGNVYRKLKKASGALSIGMLAKDLMDCYKDCKKCPKPCNN